MTAREAEQPAGAARKKRSALRWTAAFAATLALLAAAATWVSARLPTYRDPPLNFYALHEGEYFAPFGLTRRQEGAVKLGFAESQPPPLIGAFGNHIIMFFGAEAFGAPERAELFFNYQYANLSLPEVLEMLTHIEAHGRLPKKLILVQITAPNADNGRFIINHGNELPPDVVLHAPPGAGWTARAQAFAGAAWRTIETNLHEVLNYNTLILGALQNNDASRLTGPYMCQSAARPPPPSPPAWFAKLPWAARKNFAAAVVRDYCRDGSWSWMVRRDGSIIPPPASAAELIRDEDPLEPKDRGLKADDAAEIAKDLRAIDAVGRRNGVKVAFVITPVYETDRRDSVVNQILDRGLALAPDLTVIDDRGARTDPSLFINYYHPSPKYFRRLAGELRARGLLGFAPADAAK
jgi:hypothetical protein